MNAYSALWTLYPPQTSLCGIIVGGHGFKLWKQLLIEMQGKDVYNRPLWSGPSLDPTHRLELKYIDCNSLPILEKLTLTDKLIETKRTVSR
ncbi:hypothetical protein H5410_053929 [Solanum commersonii]|uniref:Uncharacterized protein n=1 Tax=Solanum commersonii TaxID=4109 RepID=A0A9J5X7R5_SOLCO|nr:hypothetical protein H5410_053929 [Solanum commersonii]